MAALKTTIAQWWLGLALAPIAFASTPAPDLWTAAQSSLQSCQFDRAIYWASQIDQASLGAGALYRLAWIQQRQSEARIEPPEPAPGQWVWKASGEWWSDERDTDKLSHCQQTPMPQAYSQLNSQEVTEILQPLLKEGNAQSLQVQQVLKAWLLQQWKVARSQKFAVPSEDLEWKALAVLHGGIESPLPTKFPAGRSEILAAWAVVAGDAAMEKMDYPAAQRSYQLALDQTPSQPTPALWYRVAMAQLENASDRYATLRAAMAALDLDAAPALESQYRTSLANQTCEWLGRFSSAQVRTSLEKIFGSRQWRRRAIALASQCAGPGSVSLVDALGSTAASSQERARWLSRSLGLAERAGASELVRKRAGQLASLSRDRESLAGHYFWKEVVSAQSPAIAVYRQHGFWGEADNLRLNKLRAQPTAVEKIQARRVLALPSSHTLPQLSWADPPVDFVGLFAELLGAKR